MKKKALIAVLIGVAFVTYWMFGGADSDDGISLQGNQTDEQDVQTSQAELEVELPTPSFIYIDVCGAVKKPAVVKLSDGSRAFEAIEAAGGAAPNGDTTSINLASVLSDGQQLYVPLKTETESGVSSGVSSPSGGSSAQVHATAAPTNNTSGENGGTVQGKININTADSAQLQQLKGVGPAMAKRIMDYRSANGRFTSVEDLKKVKGIGDKTLEKLRNSVSV